MAKKATAKAASGGGKKATAKRRSTGSGGAKSKRSSSRSTGTDRIDPVDEVIKLLQSPLVIDLLAVGATAALAAITEQRHSAKAEGGSSKKTLKAAGKAAASAVGRRLSTEFEEIKAASKKAGEQRKPKAGAGA
jgi:hypothetical protein